MTVKIVIGLVFVIAVAIGVYFGTKKSDNELEWKQIGQSLYGESSYDYFGKSVSLSNNGSTLAVGATGAGPIYDGKVYVYSYNGSTWVDKGPSLVGYSNFDISFGNVVSLSSSGNYLAVGASDKYVGTSAGVGAVYVYQYDGASWTMMGSSLDLVGGGQGDYFGSDVSLIEHGNGTSLRFAGGAYGVSTNTAGGGNNAGAAYVYEWNGSAWNQMGTSIFGQEKNDYFGDSVSLSNDGKRFASGAYGVSTNTAGGGNNAGAAYVYEWDGTDWHQIGSSIFGQAKSDYFGFAVSLSSDGNRLTVGARGVSSPTAGNFAGAAYVYDWDGTSWNQIGSSIFGQVAHDYFGWKVSLSNDGNRLTVSAQGVSTDTVGGGNYAGAAYVYDWNGSDWVKKKTAYGVSKSDRFGDSVSLSGDGKRFVGGAYKNDGSGNNVGAAYVYEYK